MKKLKLMLVLLVSVLLMGVTNVYAETPTLEQIANTFNNSSLVKNYKDLNYNMTATSGENKITVTITSVELDAPLSFDFTLDGTILSFDIDESKDEDFAAMVSWMVLVDSVGQLHGYEDGALFPTLNSDEAESYTVEEEGFEYKKISENVYRVKVDIAKKVPLVTSIYIKISDLEDAKEFISGDGSASMNKGNVWFSKTGNEGKFTLLVAEKNELTSNAYNSILSILTVMFDSNAAATYFQMNYPEITSATKEFAGIKIEVNPTKTESEQTAIPDSSGYKFVRMTIDKQKYQAGMAGKPSEDESESESESIVNVPNTAKNVGFRFLVYGCFLILAGAGTVFYVLTKKSTKEGLQ